MLKTAPLPGTVLRPISLGERIRYSYRLTVAETYPPDTTCGVVMTRCQHHRLADAHGTIEPATIHGDIWLDDLSQIAPGRWACPSDDPDEFDPDYYEACRDTAPGQLQLF